MAEPSKWWDRRLDLTEKTVGTREQTCCLSLLRVSALFSSLCTLHNVTPNRGQPETDSSAKSQFPGKRCSLAPAAKVRWPLCYRCQGHMGVKRTDLKEGVSFNRHPKDSTPSLSFSFLLVKWD